MGTPYLKKKKSLISFFLALLIVFFFFSFFFLNALLSYEFVFIGCCYLLVTPRLSYPLKNHQLLANLQLMASFVEFHVYKTYTLGYLREKFSISHIEIMI